MGMAASQAKLLTLTARLNDVEYKAQNLQAQKLDLATQRDELYQKYCAALDATEFKVAFRNSSGKEEMKDANYSTLCTYNKYRKADYALIDNNTGKVIVTEDIKNAYDRYGAKDKYAFAWAAMGLENDLTWDQEGARGDILSDLGPNGSSDADWDLILDSDKSGGYHNGKLYMTDVEYEVYEQMKSSYPELENKFNELKSVTDKSEEDKLYKEFRDLLYSTCGRELWDAVNRNKNNSADVVFNKPDVEWSSLEGEFKYYTRMWEAINQAGGCVTIEESNQTGEEGNQWFYNMVKSGQVGIMYIERSNDDSWDDTSIATSVNDNYLQEIEADERKIKKAEAEYENGLDLITRKDTKFDTELSKLETERTTITTEMDSIKKVKDDNIERTFGIFS